MGKQRKTFSLFACALVLVLAVMFAATAAWADTTQGNIEVASTDPCVVSLIGVSDNAKGYDEQEKVDGKGRFSVVLDEPGTYEYEMKQIASQGLSVYDNTVYQVWVSAYYDGATMQSVVTGGIKGTNDKPDAFKFAKPDDTGNSNQNDYQSTNDNKPSNKETSNSSMAKTGDPFNILFWGGLSLGALLFSILGAVMRRRTKNDEID